MQQKFLQVGDHLSAIHLNLLLKMAKGETKGVALAYLMLYNLACCAGWAYVLYICIKHIAGKSLSTTYDEVEFPLKVVQTAAVLEVVHSMVGLVSSPWQTALMQVFSRVWTLWAVMHPVRSAQTTVFFVLACTSWGLVEVPRYLFYALNLINAVPYPLFWLRYSLFAVLYPTGITGEVGCMIQALMYMATRVHFLEQPLDRQIHIGAIVFVLLTYIPGSPKMFFHMVKTRAKQFEILKNGGKKDGKKKH